jgi:serine protease
MRFATWILLGIATVAGATVGIVQEVNRVRTHPHTSPNTGSLQLIVKLRTSSETGVSAEAVSPDGSEERMNSLASRAGVALGSHRAITSLMHSVHVDAGSPDSANETLARLRADPQVEYAELDQRRYIHAAPITPNDPLYSQQWYLQAPNATQPSATDATDAWITSEGSSTLVIADIDTGVRPSHPDLPSAARLLTGYCFISDSFVSNSNATTPVVCPGPGAVDPGDWVTSSDVTGHSTECGGANADPSSWHGTRVAGVLGALTNNGVGVSGMTWNGKLLPVRALGKCGGSDSDIITAMLWAGGIAVSGAPTNPNPARIINMSLGGTGACPASYQDAIDQLTALGVLIVVSAGNEEGIPVDAPANCRGVAGVAGLRQAGTKVGFSNIGPEIALSAPAGNCVNAGTQGQPCLYSITTATNLGYQQADADDYTGQYYCSPATGGSYAGCSLANGNQYRTYNVGTSFSAPIVSGIGALMLSVNSKLNSCQLISRLQKSALPFPATSVGENPQPPACTVPTSTSAAQNECICTTSTCGAGMANASGALQAALQPIAAIAVPSSVSPGEVVTLDGSGSAAANQESISGYQWSTSGGATAISLLNATTSKASLTLPSCGVATVSLTVTDGAGNIDTADVVVTPASLITSAPSSAGANCSTSATNAVVVGICPASAVVTVPGGTEDFSASLANTTSTQVTWKVNGVPGGNSIVGTVSSAGVYTGPASVPSPATVAVEAVSAASPSAVASAGVTLAMLPTIVTQPANLSVTSGQSATFSVSASGVPAPTYQWMINGAAVAGATSSSYTLSNAPLSDNGAQITVVASNVAGSVSSAAATLTVVAAPAKSGGGGSMDWLSLAGLVTAVLTRCRSRMRRDRVAR